MARILPDILRAYEAYIKPSDAAYIFHLWTAIGTIAGAAQRKIFMHTAHYDVLSNLYILLVSPPGRGKKTTALRTGKNILKQVEPKVNFATESSSPEGLIKLFTKIQNPAHQSLTLYSSELGTLMSTNASGMVDFLNDIYDGNPDWSRQTVAHDLQAITRPWLNLMAATTPKWLGDNLGLIAVEGGLVARLIIPYSEARILNNPFPEDTPELKEIRDAVIQDLSHVATLEFEFEFQGGRKGDARLWYDGWYQDERRFPEIADPRTASYYDRKHIHLLKVAMALSLSYKDDPEITLGDLQAALKLLDKTEPGMRKALSAVGKNEYATEMMYLQMQIRSKGFMSLRDIVIENLHAFKDRRKLDEALGQLLTMQKIRQKGTGFEWVGVAEAAEG